MDSCPLAAIIEARPGDLSKDGNEMEVTSLEEAKSVIAALRARQRAQAHQMLAWRRTLKLQVKTKLSGKGGGEEKIHRVCFYLGTLSVLVDQSYYPVKL